MRTSYNDQYTKGRRKNMTPKKKLPSSMDKQSNFKDCGKREQVTYRAIHRQLHVHNLPIISYTIPTRNICRMLQAGHNMKEGEKNTP
jgi:hypothetical protein